MQAHVSGGNGSVHAPLVLVSIGLLPVTGSQAHCAHWLELAAAGAKDEGGLPHMWYGYNIGSQDAGIKQLYLQNAFKKICSLLNL